MELGIKESALYIPRDQHEREGEVVLDPGIEEWHRKAPELQVWGKNGCELAPLAGFRFEEGHHNPRAKHEARVGKPFDRPHAGRGEALHDCRATNQFKSYCGGGAAVGLELLQGESHGDGGRASSMPNSRSGWSWDRA